MVYGPFNILLKYFILDLPLIITSFICMFFVFQVYYPKTGRARKWTSLLIIELFEHLILPIILLFELIATDSWVSSLLFQVTLLLFLFGFLGFFILKARTKIEWFRVTAIAGFAYFFIYFYPFILIYIQLNSNINGWLIMGVTIALFFGIYLLGRNKQINLNTS